MKKFRQRFIVYLILFSYLGLFFANVYHYHNYTFTISSQEKISAERKIVSSQHSFDNCLVNSTFNSIHNSYLSFARLDLKDNSSSNLFVICNAQKVTSFHSISQKLRAPPLHHS